MFMYYAHVYKHVYLMQVTAAIVCMKYSCVMCMYDIATCTCICTCMYSGVHANRPLQLIAYGLYSMVQCSFTAQHYLQAVMHRVFFFLQEHIFKVIQNLFTP